MRVANIIAKHDNMRQNILMWLDRATLTQWQNGLVWYRVANSILADFSLEFGLPLNKICGIVAALSPSIHWKQNILDAYNLIRYETDFTPGTYGRNAGVAFDILWDYDKPENLIKGKKTFPFFHNLLYPQSSKMVTIDRHVARLQLDIMDVEYARTHINTPLKHAAMVNPWLELADVFGLLPLQLQSICWLTFKAKLEE